MEENENTGVIYVITNIINNKKYIGQALSYVSRKNKLIKHGFQGRFKNHAKSATRGSDECPKLYAAIRKYGIDKFKIELLEVCNISELHEKETHYIKTYDTITNGYNIVLTYNDALNHEPKAIKDIKNMRSRRIEILRTKAIERHKKDPSAIKKMTSGLIKAAENKYLNGEKESGLPINIRKKEDGGYKVVIQRNKINKVVNVNDIDKSDNENLLKAIEIRDIMLKNLDADFLEKKSKKLDYNGNPLPKHITICKGKRNGYKLQIKKNGKIYNKSFVDKNKSMDEKLELAKAALKNMLDLLNEQLVNNSE
jgi:hypothetical protein